MNTVYLGQLACSKELSMFHLPQISSPSPSNAYSIATIVVTKMHKNTGKIATKRNLTCWQPFQSFIVNALKLFQVFHKPKIKTAYESFPLGREGKTKRMYKV